MELRTKIVSAVIRSLKLPPRFRLKIVKEDPVRLELSLTPSYGKNPIIVGLVNGSEIKYDGHRIPIKINKKNSIGLLL